MCSKLIHRMFLFFTSKGFVLSVDSEFNVTDTIGYSELGINYLTINDYKFIGNNKRTLIVNNIGQKVADINVPFHANIIGNTLYSNKHKCFIAIDLQNVLKTDTTRN